MEKVILFQINNHAVDVLSRKQKDMIIILNKFFKRLFKREKKFFKKGKVREVFYASWKGRLSMKICLKL